MTSTQHQNTIKRKPQARGNARRQALLDAAELLLESHEFDDIAMADIARQADIPTASCYSLFANCTEIFSRLNNRFSERFVSELSDAIATQEFADWMAIIDYCCDFMIGFYERNPPFSRIMLSGKAPSEVRYSEGRIKGSVHARRLLKFIDSQFLLPVIDDPIEKFTVTIDMIDGIVASGFIRENRIPKTVVLEAKHAAKAYLSLYIPKFLPSNRNQYSQRTLP